MTFLICILIVYGWTLLVVQAKILSNFKIFLSNIILKLYNMINLNPEYFKYLIETNHKLIDEKSNNLYKHILTKLSTSTDIKTINDLGTLLIELETKIKENILKNIKYKILVYKTLHWGLNTFLELISCMMCSGFWIGIIFTIINMIFNISIYGYALNVVSTQGDFAIIITITLLGFLYSGTCWAINSLIDFFVEIKTKLGSFLDKKQQQ